MDSEKEKFLSDELQRKMNYFHFFVHAMQDMLSHLRANRCVLQITEAEGRSRWVFDRSLSAAHFILMEQDRHRIIGFRAGCGYANLLQLPIVCISVPCTGILRLLFGAVKIEECGVESFEVDLRCDPAVLEHLRSVRTVRIGLFDGVDKGLHLRTTEQDIGVDFRAERPVWLPDERGLSLRPSFLT